MACFSTADSTAYSEVVLGLPNGNIVDRVIALSGRGGCRVHGSNLAGDLSMLRGSQAHCAGDSSYGFGKHCRVPVSSDAPYRWSEASEVDVVWNRRPLAKEQTVTLSQSRGVGAVHVRKHVTATL